MHIDNVTVKYYHTSKMTCLQDGLFHEKSLPCLSIVQATEGQYGIAIDRGPAFYTGSRGAFIAPSNKLQTITHHIDPRSGVMRCQWVFLDVLLNDQYRLDDLYNFPVLLSGEYCEELDRIISSIAESSDACDRQIEVLKLVKILLQIGTPKPLLNSEVSGLIRYIHEHYTEKITAACLAGRANMSVPTLHRVFKRELGVTPLAYVNDYRLSRSVILLEMGGLPLAEIASATGFGDPFYFSRVFRKKYGISPRSYRQFVEQRQP